MLPCFGSNNGHRKPHHEHMKSFTSGGIFASMFTKGQCIWPRDHRAWRLIGNCWQTATQLTEAVTEKIKVYYREPAQVTVIVSQVNSYAIYVLGEVKTQGKQVVHSGTTFLQAVSLAGGFTQFASTSKITLRRRDSTGKETALSIRYKDVLTGRQANLVLQPGDTIIVP